MVRRLIRLLAAAGVVTLALAARPDFRKANWGMTQEQVRATEPGQPVDVSQTNGETIVKYDAVKAPAIEGRLIYIFAQDKLVRAKYISNAEHTELNDFIIDFQSAEPQLTEQYGKPSNERAVWENDAFQQERLPYLDQDRALPSEILPSDPNIGLSVSLGYLKLFTQRSDAGTKIVHALTGENHRIIHQLEYRSIQLESLENKLLDQISTGGR
jgi:hypothetical protein